MFFVRNYQQQHFDDELPEAMPLAKERVLADFYVDQKKALKRVNQIPALCPLLLDHAILLSTLFFFSSHYQ